MKYSEKYDVSRGHFGCDILYKLCYRVENFQHYFTDNYNSSQENGQETPI